MSDPLGYLADELHDLRERGLFRWPRRLDGPQEPVARYDGREVINLCSALRLGVALGFAGLPPLSTINQLLVLTQPAHLMRGAGRALEAPERNVLRADLVRAHLERAISETGPGGRG